MSQSPLSPVDATATIPMIKFNSASYNNVTGGGGTGRGWESGSQGHDQIQIIGGQILK